MSGATVAQRGERRLQVDRPWSGECAGARADLVTMTVECAQRTDARGGGTGVEEMAEEARRRRLPVGAGDGEERQMVAGIAVPGSRGGKGRATAVVHDDLRNGDLLCNFDDGGHR